MISPLEFNDEGKKENVWDEISSQFLDQMIE